MIANYHSSEPKFILSGGGTGGHIFPAVAIAKELQRHYPNAKFLFVGALGKMEMEKVPKEGFEIVGLPIEGLKRSLSPRNLVVFMKTVQSFWKSRKILKDFKPTAVIGTGGYASLPVCLMAARSGYPTFLQEQNGFAGLTNRLVAARAKQIFTGFPNMERFFPRGNWTFTGNPVRQNIIEIANNQTTRQKEAAIEKFGLSAELPVLFITGGSLGARTINQTIFNNLTEFAKEGIQIIWQMGLPFANAKADEIEKIISNNPNLFIRNGIKILFHSAFIYNIDDAFTAADVVISRAGAISISEIAIVGKPSILVPSPNVTDDHQTQNAKVLSEMGAAEIITDKEATKLLVSASIELIKDTKKRAEMQEKLKQIAKPTATESIVNHIITCLKPNA